MAAGGDWGAVVTEWMGVQAPPELIGIHINFPGVLTPDIAKGIQTGAPAPPGLSAEEKQVYDTLKAFFAKSVGYAIEMGFRPQTLYAIEDSPVGLAAGLWITTRLVWSLSNVALTGFQKALHQTMFSTTSRTTG